MAEDIENILKGFVRHVVNLAAEEDPAGTGFHKEFRMLREAQIQNKNVDLFPAEVGQREENVKKNRYKDILPRDDRRVKLQEIDGEKGSDYINATFIEDVHGNPGYIAAQGPMPHTVNDFWRMLWEQNAEIVFMVCRLKEDGKAKCEKYWAEKGEQVCFGDITITTESEEEIQEHFLMRHLRAEKDGTSKHIRQFHYTGWPDHNTPSSPDALRTMIENVRNYRKKMHVPMVVHCSAGCGRTGTICAIDYAWTLLDKGMISKGFSMFEIIKSLREQRMSMVQTPDQYEYTHMVMKSLCNEWLADFAKNDYENVPFGESPLEEPEQDYYNVGFPAAETAQMDSKGWGKQKVVSLSSAPKEAEIAVQSSKASSNEKPGMKHQKPSILSQKPQPGAPLHITGQQPKTLFTPQGTDPGEYVEVRKTASLPGSAAELTDKKNSVETNRENVDPIKTTNKLEKSSQQPKLLGIGTGKKQVPTADVKKPVVIFTSSAQQRRPNQQQQPAHDVYGKVEKQRQTSSKDANTSSYENVPQPDYNTNTVSDPSVYYFNNGSQAKSGSFEAAPDVPTRHYRPEEVSPNKDSCHSADGFDYEKIAVPASPHSHVVEDRAPYPLPKKTQRDPGPVQFQTVPAKLKVYKETQPIVHAQRQQHIPGMVSAMGGRPPDGLHRKGSGKSTANYSTTQSGVGEPVRHQRHHHPGLDFTDQQQRPVGPRVQPANWRVVKHNTRV